ncbi:MAG: hypothetical protein AAGL99_03695 [Pseudomonadota bacterium]
MKITRYIAFVIFLLSQSAPAALACSLAPGAFLQSNFELIDSSDAIVVATAIRENRANSAFDSEIEFKVEAVLKGAPGKIVIGSGQFGEPVPSDPEEVLNANPEAYMGPCVRITFESGRKYVLTLHRSEDGSFVVSGGPFSRRSEDYFGPNSHWERVISEYLEIQRNPDRLAQIDEMIVIAQNGLSEDASKFEQRLGEDAFVHLVNVHPDKPTRWLINQYQDPEFVARQFSDVIEGTQEEDASNIASLVFGSPIPPEETKSMILRALSEGEHPSAEHLFRSIINEEAPDPTIFGAAIGYFIRQGKYELVQAAVNEKLLWMVAVTGEGAGPGFWGAVQPSIGYGENKRVPESFYNWWSDQKYAVCVLQSQPGNCRYDWDNADKLLREPNENQTQLLSIAGSPKVIAWAISEVDRLRSENIEMFKDEWDLPMELLLSSHKGNTSTAVKGLACGSKSERENLARRIGQTPTIYTKRLLREMMSMPQHDHVRAELFKSSVQHAAHDMENSRWRRVDDVLEYAKPDGLIKLKDHERPILPCSMPQAANQE